MTSFGRVMAAGSATTKVRFCFDGFMSRDAYAPQARYGGSIVPPLVIKNTICSILKQVVGTRTLVFSTCVKSTVYLNLFS